MVEGAMLGMLTGVCQLRPNRGGSHGSRQAHSQDEERRVLQVPVPR